MPKNQFLNAAFRKQLLATLAASLGSFSWGQSIGWSSVVNPHLREPQEAGGGGGFGLDDDGASWVGSSLSMGGFVGGLTGGWLMNRLGRRRSLLLVTLISLGSWLMLATSRQLVTVCIGRFVGGWVAACDGLIAPVYVGEIASSRYRGAFGSLLCLFLAFGITFVFTLGALVTNWQYVTAACIVPVVLGLLLLLVVPESPYHLMSYYNDEKLARQSLSWLCNNETETIEQSMLEIQDYLKTNEVSEKLSKAPKNLFQQIDNVTWRLMFVLSMIMVFSRLSGISPLSYYLVEIFNKSSLTFDPFWSAVIVSLMEIVGMVISLVLTDKLGRRILLLLSGSGITICLLILGWSFNTLLTSNEADLSPIMRFAPLITILVFYLFFSIGYAPVPIVLLSELFPSKTKSLATSVAISVLWLFDFAVAKLYFLVSDKLGVDGNFYLLAALSFVGIIFIAVFVPETKNKTLAEIQTVVEKQKTFITSCSRSLSKQSMITVKV